MTAIDYSTKNVLVVDDETTTRMTIRKIVEQMGVASVVTVKDGEEALAKLRAQPFDCVVLDWNLPKMSGIALLRTLRAETETAALPVLMVTAEAREKSIREAVSAGATHYVVKPVTPHALEQKLALIFTPDRAKVNGSSA